MQIATKKIGVFLKSLTDAEYIYMRHCMEFRDLLKGLIDRYKLDKATICDKFNVAPEDYESYIKGDYNYSVHDMAVLNHLSVILRKEEIEENPPYQIAK